MMCRVNHGEVSNHCAPFLGGPCIYENYYVPWIQWMGPGRAPTRFLATSPLKAHTPHQHHGRILTKWDVANFQQSLTSSEGNKLFGKDVATVSASEKAPGRKAEDLQIDEDEECRVQ